MFADMGTAGDSEGCPSPDDDGPRGRWGKNQHGELAVVEQAQRAEQTTADRDLFSFHRGEGGASLCAALPCRVSPRRVAMEGRWSDVAEQRADERVPLLY